MNSKNPSSHEDEIDLLEIILSLWKAKYLIISISVLFMMTGYFTSFFYEKRQPDVYLIKFSTREAPTAFFIKYKPFRIQSYNHQFKLNFESLNNLVMFSEQYDKINELKSYLKENNIDLKNFFKDKIKYIVSSNSYVLTHSGKFLTEEFLYDYTDYIKKIVQTIIKEQCIINIEEEIKKLSRNLTIAKKLELENPFYLSMLERNTVLGFQVPGDLFYKGSYVLSKEILYLEKLLAHTKDWTLDHEPIMDIRENLLPKNKKNLTMFGLLLGVFLSILIVFIKTQLNIYKKKTKL
jgi:LPS O-antigen subunit length determinant protein (WzzB/FepE family)